MAKAIFIVVLMVGYFYTLQTSAGLHCWRNVDFSETCEKSSTVGISGAFVHPVIIDLQNSRSAFDISSFSSPDIDTKKPVTH